MQTFADAEYHSTSKEGSNTYYFQDNVHKYFKWDGFCFKLPLWASAGLTTSIMTLAEKDFGTLYLILNIQLPN